MKTFVDSELGEISVRHSKLSRSIRMRLSAQGTIIAYAPMRTPLIMIKQAVRSSRKELNHMMQQALMELYIDGQQLGQSHTLRLETSDKVSEINKKVDNRVLIVTVPNSVEINSPQIQHEIRSSVRDILRKEAKAYLPKRLQTLANRHGYSYSSVRLPHATGRWGSCSSNGTISLNIALMKLPLELIDYVIYHELAHTIEMNHSKAFWDEVRSLDPLYRQHRDAIQKSTPII